jgi:NDP-sugar pyrophosphorylase family protein
LAEKYIICPDLYITIHKYGHGMILHRIKALKDFNDVKAGDIGGYVQSEYNLSQYGTSWIYGDARAYSKAIVLNNAILKDEACISGNAILMDNAIVGGSCCIKGCARVGEDVELEGAIQVYGNAYITGSGILKRYEDIIDSYVELHNGRLVHKIKETYNKD